MEILDILTHNLPSIVELKGFRSICGISEIWEFVPKIVQNCKV